MVKENQTSAVEQPKIDSNIHYVRGMFVMKKIHQLRELVKDVTATKMNAAGMHYNYLSERNLTTAVRPQMQKLGLVAVPVQSESKTTSHMVGEKDGKPKYVLLTEESKKYMVMDVDTGDYITISVEGSGADATDKGTNKAETGCKKNFYKELLNLPSPERDDPDTTPSTSYSSGASSGSYGDVGSILLKYGSYAGKTIRQVYEENPNAIKEMAQGNSKWLAEKAQAFLKTVNAA